MAWWDSWYDKATSAALAVDEATFGLFVDLPSGTPGVTEGGPNWEEINRVLSLPGNEGAKEQVDQVLSRPVTPGPSLADTLRSYVPPIQNAFGTIGEGIQTTLTKLVIIIVVVVVGLALLNIFLNRATR